MSRLSWILRIGSLCTLLAPAVVHASGDETGYDGTKDDGQLGAGLSDDGLGTNGHRAASTGYITPFYDPSGDTACVDVGGGSSKAGSPITMWGCSGGASQSWKLGRAGRITGIDHQCFDVPDSSATPGTKVQLYPCNGGKNQQWDWKADHTIRSGLASNLCLSVSPKLQIYGSNGQFLYPGNDILEIDTCNSDPYTNENQLWMINGVGEFRGIGSTSGLAKDSLPDDYCLDILDDYDSVSADPGTRVDYFNCQGISSQMWTFTPGGLIIGLGGLCLDVDSPYGGGSDPISDHTKLVVNECSMTSKTQHWSYDSDTMRLQNEAAGSGAEGCLDQTNGDVNNDPQVYTCQSGVDHNEQWTYWQPLTVPLEPQQETDWCWFATSKMIMDYLGNWGSSTPSQCEIANFMEGTNTCCPSDWGTPDGTNCNNDGRVWSVLNSYGYSFAEGGVFSWTWALWWDEPDVSVPTFQQLRDVITSWEQPWEFEVNWNSGGYHYMLLIDAEVDQSGEGWVVVNDPYGSSSANATAYGAKGDQFAMPYDVWANTDSSQYNFTIEEAISGFYPPEN